MLSFRTTSSSSFSWTSDTAAGTTATTALTTGGFGLPFFLNKPVINSSFWVALLVLVAFVDAAATVAISVDIHNVMK